MTKRSLDDWSLMQRVAKGDRVAVAELYKRFGGMVFRHARQLLPTQPDAEDAVQEVFVRLWQSADRYDPNRATLSTWVMLITRRLLVDQLRRIKVRPNPGEFDDRWPPADTAESEPDRDVLRSERRQRLLERIAGLPDLQRQVIERAYLGGRTLREISEELDKPLGTIKSALSRALAVLRERIPTEEGLAR